MCKTQLEVWAFLWSLRMSNTAEAGVDGQLRAWAFRSGAALSWYALSIST